ncbi:polysaccharide deacetylase family protein [Sphingomonas oryzagri]
MRPLALIGAVALAALVAGAGAAAHPRLAITFDDLPAHGPLPAGETRSEIAATIAKALTDADVPSVYGMINGVLEEREPGSADALTQWRAAGLPLGNHGWSHTSLDTMTPDQFEAELVRNEPLLSATGQAQSWRWFRYPYLDEGKDPAVRDAARAILSRHGYRIAAVTMSFADYSWNEPYARCVAKGDQAAIAGLEQSYLAAAERAITASRAASKTIYGHDIPNVLLMHVGAFDARMAPRLLALYRHHGFRFVTLGEAESDPAYRADVDPSLPFDATSLAHHLPAPDGPLRPAGFDPAELGRICR